MFNGSNPIDLAQPGGLGLGLVIARGIVEAHEGRIWVESQIGTGSCFRFTLPAFATAGEEDEMIRA
jgi:histidine kinase